MEKPWLQHYPADVPVNIDPNYYPCTIGMPMPFTDVRIADDNGNPLPPGSDHLGEIQAFAAGFAGLVL